MNDMLRPALYNAWMALSPTDNRSDITTTSYDVVGPVCETGDFLGKDRTLAITEEIICFYPQRVPMVLL